MTKNDNSLGRYVSIIYRYGQIYLSKKLEPLNIGSGQYVFLLTLSRHPGINQEELSDYVKIDKATTAKAVKLLMNTGYVQRKTDEHDKRAYKVYLTEQGKAIIPKIHEAIKKWESCLTANFDSNDSEAVLDLLHQIAVNAYNITNSEEENEKCTL